MIYSEAKVAESAIYGLLAVANEDSFDIDPRSQSHLRFLMLRPGAEFTPPVVEITGRFRARLVIVRTRSARWVVCGRGSAR